MDGWWYACTNIWMDAWICIYGWMLSAWKSVWPSSLSALGPSSHLVNGWSYRIDKWMNGWMDANDIHQTMIHRYGSILALLRKHVQHQWSTCMYVFVFRVLRTVGTISYGSTFLRRSSSFRWHRWWLMLTLSQWWLLQQSLLHSLQLMLLNQYNLLYVCYLHECPTNKLSRSSPSG